MNIRATCLLTTLLLLPAAGFSAEQAYTWTDENGTRHFSEEPPFDETIPAKKIDLLPAPSAGTVGGDDDYYSVANQADRMEKKRLENEKLTAERLQAEIEASKASSEAPTTLQTPDQENAQEYTKIYPRYPKQFYKGPQHAPGNKPHPKQPLEPEQLPDQRPTTSIGN